MAPAKAAVSITGYFGNQGSDLGIVFHGRESFASRARDVEAHRRTGVGSEAEAESGGVVNDADGLIHEFGVHGIQVGFPEVTVAVLSEGLDVDFPEGSLCFGRYVHMLP